MATELQTKNGVVRVPTGTWHVDPAHSSVEFEIKHLMISTVRGRFREFEGTIIAAEDIRDSRAFGAVETASVDTNQPDRDAHLRSPDFFDCARYPKARFESASIEPLGGPEFRVRGKLTIKDVTRDVEFAATVEGAQRDPWGNERVGIRASTSIDRKDFGLTWQRAIETGGFVLGDAVKIIVDVSAVCDADT
jgi:polyisoprenoid-binding protein YceI